MSAFMKPRGCFLAVATTIVVLAPTGRATPVCPGAPGCLDATFGTGGVVELDLATGGQEWADSVAIQPDGKTVLAGKAAFGMNRVGRDFSVVRLNPDGSPDGSFGTAGVVRIQFTTADDGEGANDVVLVPDQENPLVMDIVVAGWAPVSGGRNPVWGFAVARLNANGEPDEGFGGGTGKVLFNFAARKSALCFAMVARADGRLILAGPSEDRIAMAQLLPNGSFDPSFAVGGKLVTKTVGTPHSVVIQNTGRVVAGVSSGLGYVLYGFTQAGVVDPTFGSAGRFITSVQSNSDVGGLAIDAAGRLIAAGRQWVGTTALDVAVARVLPGGVADTSFGTNGRVVFRLQPNSESTGVVVDSLGRIVVAVDARSSDYLSGDFVALRLDDTGALDQTFGDGGVVTVDVDTRDAASGGVALDPSTGMITLAGRTSAGSNATMRTVALRLLP